MRLDRDPGPRRSDVTEGHPEMTPLLGQGEAALVEASAGWLDPRLGWTTPQWPVAIASPLD